jgi:hypothetical protein
MLFLGQLKTLFVVLLTMKCRNDCDFLFVFQSINANNKFIRDNKKKNHSEMNGFLVALTGQFSNRFDIERAKSLIQIS